ncbi:MAG: sigma-70 family RNA polymerase sigma factor [Ignavibacteria bacterium]|nr:sigma-70 family RNA polymerase sigma factor [Ignavibacteria bacterium]
MQSDDNEIIENFKNGNQNAFNLLVLKYQKKIYWVIRKMVLDHDDADDITQEVFIKLYKSIDKFRGESQFYTYIYKIAVNLSLNHLNKNKRNYAKKINLDSEAYKIKSKDKSSDEHFDDKNRTKILEDAISTLPDQQRAVFNLRFYDNLSYDEIARILNKSTGGMKANYFHAVKKIEVFLKSKKNFEEIIKL